MDKKINLFLKSVFILFFLSSYRIVEAGDLLSIEGRIVRSWDISKVYHSANVHPIDYETRTFFYSKEYDYDHYIFLLPSYYFYVDTQTAQMPEVDLELWKDMADSLNNWFDRLPYQHDGDNRVKKELRVEVKAVVIDTSSIDMDHYNLIKGSSYMGRGVKYPTILFFQELRPIQGLPQESAACNNAKRIIKDKNLSNSLEGKEFLFYSFGQQWIIVSRESNSFEAFNGQDTEESFQQTIIPYPNERLDNLFLYDGGLDIKQIENHFSLYYDCFAHFSNRNVLTGVWDSDMEKAGPPNESILFLLRIMSPDLYGYIGWDNKDIPRINKRSQFPIQTPEGDALKLELTNPEGYGLLIQTDSDNSYVTYRFQYPNNSASEIYVIIKLRGINNDDSSSELYHGIILNSKSGYSKRKLYWREIEYQGYFVGYKNVSFRERHRFKKALSTIKIEYE